MPEPVDLNFVTTDVMGGSFLQWATPFTDLKDMVDKAIAKLKPGECIRRLVIAGHGADHTAGFMVFDPDTSGIQTIDGGTKQPIHPSVVTQLQRLRAHFCKDAIIEFRVCRFGEGTNGEKAMQAVADAAGVAVTAPMGSISSLAAIGGLATDWRVAYPKSWGLSTKAGYFRGSPRRPPPGVAPATAIAPVTSQVVPLRGAVSTLPPVPPPVRKVSIADPAPRPRWLGLTVTGAALMAALGVGWIASNALRPVGGTAIVVAGPSPQPTSVAVVPTATPTPQTTPVAVVPTATPAPPPTPSPVIVAPTAAPTAAPTVQPTLVAALLPADGSYQGSGTFASYDGDTSYETAWLVSKAGNNGEIAQLNSSGVPFQRAPGIIDPAGLLVAVNKDPGFCEVLILEFQGVQWANELFVAYGPATMTCPDPQELALFYEPLDRDPPSLEDALRNEYNWGNRVVIGSVATGGWTAP